MALNPPTPERFAAAVAAKLDQVVPPGFSVRSQGPSVDVYSAGTSRHATVGAQNLRDMAGRPLDKEVEGIAWAILNGVQDGVMEILTEQWPMGQDGRAAEPGARVQGDELRMWFGEEGAPIVALSPLNLRELVEGAA